MTNIAELEKQVEELVREYVASCQQAAAAAVERAFGTATSPEPRGSGRKSRRSSRPSPTKRRNPEELAALSEQLYAAVCAKPGETMKVLAADVGVTPRELSRPMTLLKRAGKVRSTGQRHQTRYFPMVASKAA